MTDVIDRPCRQRSKANRLVDGSTDSRPPYRRLKVIPYNKTLTWFSQTRGPSPRLVEFRESARRLFRAPFPERVECARNVIAGVLHSREPGSCVNLLIDEAVNRGGVDGLDMGAHILAQFPTLLKRKIDSHYRGDLSRRVGDRQLGYPRYREGDEVWALLLDALARTKPAVVATPAVLKTFRMVAASATQGMYGGLATALASVAERGPVDRAQALTALKTLLVPEGGRPPLSDTARQTIEGYVSDLEG